jgi:putative redox protein
MLLRCDSRYQARTTIGKSRQEVIMKARIKWVEGRTFVGQSGSGHNVVLGTASEPEGSTPGPSPMEMVLIGTGGCSAFDVVHILEKGRQPVEDCIVELSAERADQEPKVFTRIHMHFVVKGRGLATSKVERAIALSIEKYCSASAMLAKTATITHDFEVVDTTAASPT